MKKILVTGFEPFDAEVLNPSQAIIERLPANVAGVQVVACLIPTAFKTSAARLKEVQAEEVADYILCIGQAGGRAAITPERVAINLDDASIPDNLGQQPLDETIQVTGPAAYFSQHPVKAIARRLHEAGLPAAVSNTAGTYVCNHLMYSAIHLTTTQYPAAKAGFIHVPYQHEQVLTKPNTPSLSLDEMVRGIELAIDVIVTVTKDLQWAAGTTH